jgi:hypothetical protein
VLNCIVVGVQSQNVDVIVILVMYFLVFVYFSFHISAEKESLNLVEWCLNVHLDPVGSCHFVSSAPLTPPDVISHRCTRVVMCMHMRVIRRPHLQKKRRFLSQLLMGLKSLR